MRIAPAATPTPPTPSRAVFDRHVRDLLSLPGVHLVRWTKDAGDSIEIRLANHGFARLADNVLRDAVDGVRFIFTVSADAPAPVPGGDSWADSASQMARVITSMPGIVDAISSSEHGLHSYTFTTYEQHVADRLKPLISERLGAYRVGFWARSLPKAPAG